MIDTIKVKLNENSYPIYLSRNILKNFAEYFDKHLKANKIAIISHPQIFKMYGSELKESFGTDKKIISINLPEGEKSKSNNILLQIYTELLENRFDRNSVILALGGGVVGDLAGYAAATFLRGVNLVQIPTSFLAQVDSSIGGKVGINHPLGKNLIGAFKQPAFVFCDTNLLKTLPDSEIRCGLGEVIKYAFIGNEELFVYLQKNLDKAITGDPDILYHLVKVSAIQKAFVVEQDEKEANLRMTLNFGHTFGHALEAILGYGKLKHGEAVILGMKCALQYGNLSNRLAENEFTRGIELLNRVPIDFNTKSIDRKDLYKCMNLDKKVSDNNLRLVLLNRIGNCYIENNVDKDLVFKSFEILGEFR